MSLTWHLNFKKKKKDSYCQIKYCSAINKLSLDWGKEEVQYPRFC